MSALTAFFSLPAGLCLPGAVAAADARLLAGARS
jgi:hypothetical protein